MNPSTLFSHHFSRKPGGEIDFLAKNEDFGLLNRLVNMNINILLSMDYADLPFGLIPKALKNNNLFFLKELQRKIVFVSFIITRKGGSK
jgi:hypothetical protein